MHQEPIAKPRNKERVELYKLMALPFLTGRFGRTNFAGAWVANRAKIATKLSSYGSSNPS
jgi:hypothetical protein